jgi:CRISPR-associated protein Cmr4
MIHTRIAIDYEKKVARVGALWTEEYLPEFSIAYSLILVSKPRKSNDKIKTASDVIKSLLEGLGGNLDEFSLILGGDETIGRGIVKFFRVG